jgi:hypothetical protein
LGWKESLGRAHVALVELNKRWSMPWFPDREKGLENMAPERS